MSKSKQIKISLNDHQILKRVTRAYNLSMSQMVSALMSQVNNWDEFIERNWNICPQCLKTNSIDNKECNECGTILVKSYEEESNGA